MVRLIEKKKKKKRNEAVQLLLYRDCIGVYVRREQ